MKLHVDKEAEALCLRLDDSAIVESEEVSPGVVLDDKASSEVVGVEMLHFSKRSSNRISLSWNSRWLNRRNTHSLASNGRNMDEQDSFGFFYPVHPVHPCKCQ